MSEDFILPLYKKPQTVFTLRELSQLYPKIPYKNLKRKVDYFVHVKKLKRLRRGIYVKENYNKFELANKIYSPSYISLETTLQQAGIIFQQYQTIFIISYLSRKISVEGINLYYRKIKDEILMNNTGVVEKKYYFQATKERAFLDAVFLYRDYHFDNLRPIDWKIIHDMKKIYNNISLEQRIAEYYETYKRE